MLVCGGGPAGIGAAIGAARAGARVTLLERHPVLGGMGTAALVNNFCPAHHDGVRLIIGGVFGEIRRQLLASGALYATGGAEPFDPAAYARVALEMCESHGVHVILGATLRDSVFQRGAVTIDVTDGRQFTARCVVDASGDAVLAEAAWVTTRFGRESDGAVMPLTMCYIIGPVDRDRLAAAHPQFLGGVDEATGERWIAFGDDPALNAKVRAAREVGTLSIGRDCVAMVLSVPGRPDHVSVNFGRVFVSDPTDQGQLAAAADEGRRQVEEGVAFFREHVAGFEGAELVEAGRQIGVRESRRIKGRYTLTEEDVLSCRQFDDVVAQCWYPIDVHEPGSDRTTMKWLAKGTHYDIPWRCLIPASGARNIVFAGRCISATSSAASSFRVSPSCMAVGEAAGVTAALAARNGGQVGNVDPTVVQGELSANGGILS